MKRVGDDTHGHYVHPSLSGTGIPLSDDGVVTQDKHTTKIDFRNFTLAAVPSNSPYATYLSYSDGFGKGSNIAARAIIPLLFIALCVGGIVFLSYRAAHDAGGTFKNLIGSA